MKNVSIYRNLQTSEAGFKIWEDPDKPTDKELTPDGADIVIYTTLPTELVEFLLGTTRDKVSQVLSDYLP